MIKKSPIFAAKGAVGMGSGFPFMCLKGCGRTIQAQSQMKLSFGGYIKDGYIKTLLRHWQ